MFAAFFRTLPSAKAFALNVQRLSFQTSPGTTKKLSARASTGRRAPVAIDATAQGGTYA
jgi:hypothetical protein